MKSTEVSGPVSARCELNVSAGQRDVWAVLADIEGWPSWNPALRLAVAEGDLEVSSRFRFATDVGTMSCTLRAVDAPRSLAWSGRLLTIGHHHSWRLEPRDGGCRVSLDAAMTGITARLLRGRLGPRLQDEIDAWARLLKLEAEARSVEETSPEEGRT